MRPLSSRTGRMIGALAYVLLSLSPALAQTATARIVSAANQFLSTLDDQQRKTVRFAFDDETQRARWSNFPTGFVPRGGLSLKEMNAAQRAAALALVSSALSKRGFDKVSQIMEADEINKTNERNHPPFGKGSHPPLRKDGSPPPFRQDGPRPFSKGGPPPPPPPPTAGGDHEMFGKDLYYLSILGTPSETDPWMLQFGGHHLALNLTIAGPQGVLTPTLTGAQPARYTQNGKTVRPLGGESDKALALLKSLDEGQRKQAVLSYRLADLVLGPGQDGKTIQPEGLKAASMNERQRALLLDVIAEWAGIVHEGAAASRMAEIKAGIDDTWFAWSGPTKGTAGQNIAAYYRIQGPKLVIEYAPQQLGGDPPQHVHTMYRDPTNDYGRRPTAR